MDGGSFFERNSWIMPVGFFILVAVIVAVVLAVGMSKKKTEGFAIALGIPDTETNPQLKSYTDDDYLSPKKQ